MATMAEEEIVVAASVKKGLLDLPSETIALIFEHATDHDLAQLCRVSKHIRELAASELYHILNHTFSEDPMTSKLTVDYLAGFLETLATSDYNYAAHVKEIYVDTGYAAGKGEQACRQFGYDLTCGKFLNTLLLAVLKRTKSLEGFYWNARIELSTAVFLALHRMPNLRRVHIRLQPGQSLHSLPKVSAAPNQSTPPLNASPISPGGAPAPPGPHSPGGYVYPQQTQPSNTFQMVPKIPVARPVSQPCSFSGFKGLKALCVLDMDTLEYVSELAECVRNSLETLKQLELSLSDTLARRAREKPRPDGSDGATSDDASSVASQAQIAGDDGAPAGGNPEQMRQWHKVRQEAILTKILAPKSPAPNAKEIETVTTAIVNQVGLKAQNELDRDAHDPAKDHEDREFVKMMRAIFRAARSKQEASSKTTKAFEKIEKAATKYLEGAVNTVEESKSKPKSKSSVIKIKTPKPPPPAWQIPPPMGSNFKSYSVHEDVLLEYFGFSKLTWDQMTSLNKNQYVQTYFKETQGIGFQPYPMPPPPPGKSTIYNKVYYANPNSIPGYIPPSKYVVIPSKKPKKPPPPKSKYQSDSDDLGKAVKLLKDVNSEVTMLHNSSVSPAAQKDKTELTDDSDMLFPTEDEEDDGPDQEFGTENEGSGDEGKRESPEMEDLKIGINGVLKESGLLDEDEASSTVVGKGKQAVRDPPNGHLTPPKPPLEEGASSLEPVAEKQDQEDPVAKYLRLSHGLPIERLAIYLVPVKAATFLQHFDAYALKNLTLLNVGSQRRIWAALTKMQRLSPLPLTGIYTDNVTAALLTFIESLEAGQLEDLYLLERYLRKKGRVPQLQDCDKTTVDIRAIRKQILKKHMKGFKRLMIRNDDSDSWAMNNVTMRLIAREAVQLRELAIQCDTFVFHTIVRSLPQLPTLHALQLSFIIDVSTPPVSMTGAPISNTHHYGGNPIDPYTSALPSTLHELRQCVADGMSFCKDTTSLEWLGFSWLTIPRGTTKLDGEGNPFVFLSRMVRDTEGDSDEDGDDEEDDDSGAESGEDEKGEAKKKKKRKRNERDTKRDGATVTFWPDNDLNISEVQGVKMWDKEIWAGRL